MSRLDANARMRMNIRGRYKRFVKAGIWKLNRKYDAYYNVRTRKWVEKKCSDKTCDYCAARPASAPVRRIDSSRSKETK